MIAWVLSFCITSSFFFLHYIVVHHNESTQVKKIGLGALFYELNCFFGNRFYGIYEFMESRNSSLSSVLAIRSWIVFIASIGFMSAMYLRRIHMRSSVVLS